MNICETIQCVNDNVLLSKLSIRLCAAIEFYKEQLSSSHINIAGIEEEEELSMSKGKKMSNKNKNHGNA